MNTIKYTVVVLGIIIAFAIGGYTYIKSNFTDTGQLTKIADDINERGVDTKPVNQNGEVKLDMTEVEVQIYLHRMTHQHVVADEKWGGIDSSPENIQNLLIIVQANQNAYKHGNFYIQVLEQWQDGNFDNAVGVHNTIWSWHGGTVGRATSLINE